MAFDATRITDQMTTIGIERAIRVIIEAVAIEVNCVAQTQITTITCPVHSNKESTITDSI